MKASEGVDVGKPKCAVLSKASQATSKAPLYYLPRAVLRHAVNPGKLSSIKRLNRFAGNGWPVA
jgi:hypothetical protein